MYSNKEILRVAYPIFLSFIAQNLVNVTDTAFLGRVGEVELGASALAGVFYMTLFMIGMGFSVGSQILIARRNGEENYGKIGEVFHHGLVFLMLLAVVIILLTQAFASNFLHSILSSPAIFEASVKFLDIRIFGLLFIFPNSLFRSFYIGITRTRILIWNAIIMASVNILLDYTLIFGHFGFPQMGIAGAALASVIAEATALLFMTTYTILTVDRARYNMNFSIHLRFSIIKRILSVSVYTMIQSFLSIGTWFIFFMGIEHLGERSLAVSNVVRSLYLLMLLPIWALSITCNTLVSNLIGAGGQDKVIPLIWRVIRLAMIIVLPLAIFIVFFPTYFIRIYTDDITLVNDTVAPLLVLTSSLLLAALGSMFFNAMSGTGNTKSALGIELISIVLYLIYMWVLIFQLQASVAWCWTTEHLYWTILFIFSFWYLRKGSWKGKVI
ncbi:MAG: MATE family efflux transporter [Bacteroidales bacterium]|nr:MATE family efflux transporter [Bacteroidales bacterium]